LLASQQVDRTGDMNRKFTLKVGISIKPSTFLTLVQKYAVFYSNVCEQGIHVKLTRVHGKFNTLDVGLFPL